MGLPSDVQPDEMFIITDQVPNHDCCFALSALGREVGSTVG